MTAREQVRAKASRVAFVASFKSPVPLITSVRAFAFWTDSDLLVFRVGALGELRPTLTYLTSTTAPLVLYISSFWPGRVSTTIASPSHRLPSCSLLVSPARRPC